MRKIRVMVNGLPGKMAMAISEAVMNSNDMTLVRYSLTGPEIIEREVVISGKRVALVKNYDVNFTSRKPDIMVDFTQPSAISENVLWYVKNQYPFVMGTTGGDLRFIKKTVLESRINAVVAPNMAKEIVLFQAMIESLSERFPGAFKELSLEVTESHQKGKLDTSGTAKAVVASFNKLGIPFSIEQINKKRSEADYNLLGVPEEFWGGHGWHSYVLRKPDNSVFLEFKHNVNGRQAYVDGTLEAVRFLNKITTLPFRRGDVFSMIDVLGG